MTYLIVLITNVKCPKRDLQTDKTKQQRTRELRKITYCLFVWVIVSLRVKGKYCEFTGKWKKCYMYLMIYEQSLVEITRIPSRIVKIYIRRKIIVCKFTLKRKLNSKVSRPWQTKTKKIGKKCNVKLIPKLHEKK